jgi:hypothetical protein
MLGATQTVCCVHVAATGSGTLWNRADVETSDGLLYQNFNAGPAPLVAGGTVMVCRAEVCPQTALVASRR